MMEVPESIRSRYMERRKKDLEICLSDLALQKFDELERVGHQLKGNAETFGYQDLSHIAIKMEKAAQSKDVDQLEDVLKDFSSWISSHPN